MIVYSPKHRIPFQVGDLKCLFSPLTWQQKSDIEGCMKLVAGKAIVDNARRAFLTVKYGVKGVTGLKTPEGKPFEMSFDPDGSLSDSSTDALLSLPCTVAMVTACANLANEVADHKIEGVKIDLSGVKLAEEKKS